MNSALVSGRIEPCASVLSWRSRRFWRIATARRSISSGVKSGSGGAIMSPASRAAGLRTAIVFSQLSYLLRAIIPARSRPRQEKRHGETVRGESLEGYPLALRRALPIMIRGNIGGLAPERADPGRL